MITNNKFEKISFIILLVTVFLSPLIFIPISYAPIEVAKTSIIVFGVLASCVLNVISALKNRNFSIPKHPIVFISVLLVVSTIISAFLSTNFQRSIIGQGFEIGTASFLVLMFVAAFLVYSLTVKNKERLIYIYGAIGLSFLFLIVFQLIKLIDPAFLSFGLFSTTTASLIGKWYDLGIFSGLVFIVTFFITRSVIEEKFIKIILYILLAISGLFVLLINFNVITSVILLTLLSYGIYYFTQNVGTGVGFKKFTSRISIPTLILVIVFSIFTWKGGAITSSIAKSLKLDVTEIFLPWQLTLDVTTDTIKSKPLFGAGPNRFGTEFLLNKPQLINSTNFWSIEFNSGFSFLSSFLVTQGIVGVILWIVFLIFFFGLGIKSLKKIKDGQSSFALISTFFTASFLWIIALLYNPAHVIIFFTFIMTGLFIAAAVSEGILEVKNFGTGESRLLNKLALIIIIASIVVLALWSLVYIKKIVAISYFQSGISYLNSAQNQQIDKSENSFKKALKWDYNDIYYQALSEVNIVKINSKIQQLQAQNQKDPKSIDKELVDKTVVLISDTYDLTVKAIEIDRTNYYNYLEQARVLEIASILNIDKSYEGLKSSYENALKYNPYNPALYLNLARVEISKNKSDDAMKYIGAALNLKNNYTDAVFLLAQVQVNKGDIKGAITSTQFATQLNPNDSVSFFQLGFLYYNDKNYQSAIDSLMKAVQLNDQYANARYFLGLSYARLGKNTEAIDQFEIIAKSNPDNEEVSLILTNLKTGKSVFTGAQPPIDTTPEKRKSLPIKEKTTVNTIKK